jgi:hypothetical protein
MKSILERGDRMKKTEFIYQRWYLRLFSAAFIVPLELVIQILFAEWMEIEYADFWYVLFCIVIGLACIGIYYKLTEHSKMFFKKGLYWTENETVYVQKGKKIYTVQNVTWLRGTTASVWGLARSGMLVIQYQKKKIVLFSAPMKDGKNFADCELLYLFETVLEHNSRLHKNDEIDFWYEVKN